jgi:hypothetical protein
MVPSPGVVALAHNPMPGESLTSQAHLPHTEALIRLDDFFLRQLNDPGVRSWALYAIQIAPYAAIVALPAGPFPMGTNTYTVAQGEVLVVTDIAFFATTVGAFGEPVELPTFAVPASISFAMQVNSADTMGELIGFTNSGETSALGRAPPFGLPAFGRYFQEGSIISGVYQALVTPPAVAITAVGMRASGFTIPRVAFQRTIRGSL